MTRHTTLQLSGTARARADAWFAELGQGTNAYLELRARRAQIARLEALSDTQLQALGLTRAGICGHVFRDRFSQPD